MPSGTGLLQFRQPTSSWTNTPVAFRALTTPNPWTEQRQATLTAAGSPEAKGHLCLSPWGEGGGTMSTTKVTIIPSAQLRPALSSFRAPYSPPGWGVGRAGQPAADGSWGSEVLSPCEPLPSLDTGAGPSSVRGGPRSHPGAVVTRSRRGAHTGKVEAEVGQSHAVPHGHTHRLGHGAPTRDAAATLRPHTPVSRAKVEQEESKRVPRHFTVIACWATYTQVFGYT